MNTPETPSPSCSVILDLCRHLKTRIAELGNAPGPLEADCLEEIKRELREAELQISALANNLNNLSNRGGYLNNLSNLKLNQEEAKFIDRCIAVIERSVDNENFGVGDIADAMAMSHSSLYKKIRALTGMSVIDLVNTYRISKAVEMLESGQRNVQAVGEKCGFRDTKTFRETFKKKTGMAPKQYMLSKTRKQRNHNTETPNDL